MDSAMQTAPHEPSTPTGYVLRALELGAVDIKSVREGVPPLVARDLTNDQILGLVRRVMEVVPIPPATAELILLEDHLSRKHKRSETPPQHHAEERIRLRREVRLMATTKTKEKPKAKAAKKEKAEKVERECHCGCGGTTRGNFCPGHDARVYSLLKKENDGEKVKLPPQMTADKDLLETMRSRVH